MTFSRRLADYLFIIYEDDSANEKSRKLSLRFCLLFWCVFIGLSFFIKQNPKENDFNEIKITLTALEEPAKSEEVVKTKTEAAQAPRPAAQNSLLPAAKESSVKEPVVKEPVAQNVPAPQKVIEQPVAKKSVPPAETRKYTVSKPQVYGKTNEQLLAEQLSSAKKEQGWNESAFSESSKSVVSSPEKSTLGEIKKISDDKALQGSAATASSENSGGALASSSTSRTYSGNVGVSDGVADSLEKIGSVRPVIYSGNGKNGLATASVVNAFGSSSSGLSIAMTDGRVRRLLEPEKPVINISEENAKLIDTSYNLKIRFKVLPDGNVLLSGISIPSVGLPQPVIAEIKNQIAKWRFAQDPSESTAVFEFSIIKK